MKDRPKHFPDWIPDVRVAKRGGSLRHVLVRETAALVYLAGQNVITPHVWMSRADDVRKPDRIVFDLDPVDAEVLRDPRGGARDRRSAARARARAARDDHGLARDPRDRSDQARAVRGGVRVREGGRVRLAEEHPKKLTTEFHKAKRGDRIFVDVLRNRYAQHAVPPYAVRPRPKAPVAAPLHWDELDDRSLKPDRWTISVDAEAARGTGRLAWHQRPRAVGQCRARPPL